MNTTHPIATVTIGHRERKKLRMRESLRDAALDLFARKGFEQTTIEDITTAVDLVPRTFFRYFPTKYDVLFDDLENVRQLWRDALRRRPAGEGAFSAVLAAMYDVLDAQSVERKSAALMERLSQQCAELRMRVAASRYESQHQMAAVLAARLGPSDAAIAHMIVSLAMTAVWLAVDEWIAAGLERPLREYAHASLEKHVAVFRSIDSEFVLR